MRRLYCVQANGRLYSGGLCGTFVPYEANFELESLRSAALKSESFPGVFGGASKSLAVTHRDRAVSNVFDLHLRRPRHKRNQFTFVPYLELCTTLSEEF